MGIVRILSRNKKINMFIQKFLINLHNKSYAHIGNLAVIYNNGLHPKHRIMNYHKFFVDNIKKGSVVLDLGCGNGALTYDLAKKARKVVGIDLNERNLRIAKKRYSRNNIQFIKGDITKCNLKEKFNAVILSNVLEHIKRRVDFLKKVKKLAPIILIRVPMINRDWITSYKKEKGCEYRLDKDHKIEYTLEDLNEELKQANLKLKKYSIQYGEIWGVVKN